MAMKITKKCENPMDKIWIGTCRNCKSSAECLRSDLMNYQPATQRDGEFSWEVCPVCDAGKNQKGYGGLLMYPAGGK